MNPEPKRKMRHPDMVGAGAGHENHRGRRPAMKMAKRDLAKALATAMLLVLSGATCAQEMPMPAQQEPAQHLHGDIALVRAEYPRMGRAQEHAQGALITLEQAQKIASETNPTLRQADAEIRAAKARHA